MSFIESHPIFIVGSARSGTTLLQLILNAHPNIAICGELHYFDKILQLKKTIPSLESHDRLKKFFCLIRNMKHIQYIPDVHKIFEVVNSRMLCDPYRSYEKFYIYALEEYAKTQKSRRFGEKTPHNVRYIDQILNMFPHAKIIHIVRDPRDVVVSMISTPWTSHDVFTNALKWKCDVLYSQLFSDKKSLFFELRYEDLVSHPERQIQEICEFIGEPYDSRMINFYKTSRMYIRNEPWKESTFLKINSNSVNKWKHEFSESQIFVIQKTTGALMLKFGYEELKIRFFSKLISFFIFGIDISKYITYKFKNNRYIFKNDFGENKKIFQMLFSSILSATYRK